ncbi:ion transporter [Tardiphaga sp. 172_B4_N1_3]|jgi:voltage-gated potassium channel|uniref:ion transporter n=1 Tax=Tardiphaga sp. 172_B4_N1_3 TaxID=3240787 RepID=UPI003F8AFFEA
MSIPRAGDIPAPTSPFRRFRLRLRQLYEGHSAQTRWFLYGLLAFDFVSLLFIIATSFLPRGETTRVLDLTFGAIFLIEFIARFVAIRRPLHELTRLTTWTDVAAIGSLLASASGEAAGFLRVLRTLRMLRTFRVLEHLRRDSAMFRRHEEVLSALANLSVFIFVMTGVVYETQRHTNPHIANYADALYFTVTALTTTGFGDITLPGTIGRLITVAIMIFGVTLFLNLARVLFNPSKVRFKCPACGLQRHDRDAVHCKACGGLLNIPDDGAV